MSGSSALVLIRHGEAQYRTADGAYLADGALTDRGIAQAQALGESLRGLAIEKAWTSPCRRARQTAAIAGLDAVMHPGLAEWRYRPYAVALEAGLPEADDPLWIWQQATGPQRNAPETLDQLVHRIDAVLAYVTGRISRRRGDGDRRAWTPAPRPHDAMARLACLHGRVSAVGSCVDQPSHRVERPSLPHQLESRALAGCRSGRRTPGNRHADRQFAGLVTHRRVRYRPSPVAASPLLSSAM
jgi:Histidine phosphatase superfamily (branch 1)